MILSSPCSAGTIFMPFYRHRSARKQYLCCFIVAARRGNNIFTNLSSPLGAETIFVPFYRHRAARERYLCRFIVAVQRENNIFAGLSSPCSTGTIFVRFSACSVIASIKIFISTFAEWRCVLEWLGRLPVCPPQRLRSGVSIPN